CHVGVLSKNRSAFDSRANRFARLNAAARDAKILIVFKANLFRPRPRRKCIEASRFPTPTLRARTASIYPSISPIRRRKSNGSRSKLCGHIRTDSPLSAELCTEGTDTPGHLLQRIAAGDKEAFHALYLRYGPRVTALVRTRVDERELVEELV